MAGTDAVKDDHFAEVEKPEPRKSVVGATVNTEEEDAILAALAQAGFLNKSIGTRIVLMAFALDTRVRDAVKAAQKKHGLD